VQKAIEAEGFRAALEIEDVLTHSKMVTVTIYSKSATAMAVVMGR